jgi:hypothetical protein
MLQKFNMTLFAAVLALFAVSISASPDRHGLGPDDDSRRQSNMKEGAPSRDAVPDAGDEGARATIETDLWKPWQDKTTIEIDELHEICSAAGFGAALAIEPTCSGMCPAMAILLEVECKG